MDFKNDDNVTRRIKAMNDRVSMLKEHDLYFYNQPIQEVRGGAKVIVRGREMGMYASYGYLGLLGHPASMRHRQKAVDQYGNGTMGSHPSRDTCHCTTSWRRPSPLNTPNLPLLIPSGMPPIYVISTSHGLSGDYVLSDKLNHASIVDGCLMSGAEFRRFKHNDMQDLESRLQQVPQGVARLVIADAVFSMDGDVIDLPKTVELCKKYDAYLMIDEAHSLGVLGQKRERDRGAFRFARRCDKNGRPEQDIPSVGGYVAGKKD
jgi:glycine C-acetyltransferase